MLIKELQKRPFARPLFIYMIGVLLQMTFSCSWLALLFMAVPFLILLWIGVRRKSSRQQNYDYELRWMWGVTFLSLLLSFAVLRTTYEQEREEVSGISIFQTFAERQQQKLLESFERLNLSDEEKSVLAALTIGYREEMSREVRKQFSVTGVAHILSVSGFHVAVVCGFLSVLFSFLPKKPFYHWLKYIGMLLLLWGFVIVAGLEPAAVRSAIMLSLFLTGRVLRRNTDSYNTLAAAAFCMLVYNPLYLFDIGFQLSYLAVWSILYLQPRLRQLILVRNPLLAKPWEWMTVTLAAQMGTTLLSLYYFRHFSLVFLSTNVPLTFLSTLLIPIGLVWLWLPVDVPGYAWVQVCVERLTHTLFGIVDAFSQMEQVSLYARIDFLFLLLGYVSLIAIIIYLRTRRFRWLMLGLLFMLLSSLELLIRRFYGI